MIDDARSRTLQGVKRAQRFFNEIAWAPFAGIITPNYDLLVEHAFGTAAFNYGARGEVLHGRGKNPTFPWQGAWPILRGDLPVAKIHGSVSWSDTIRYTDGRCGLRGDALIIPPHAGKRRPAVLGATWKLAESILKHSSKAIVFGFGFNAYDDQFLNLLSRSGRDLKAALIVDVSPKADAAHRLWPNAEIDTCVPPPAGRDCIRSWVRNVD